MKVIPKRVTIIPKIVEITPKELIAPFGALSLRDSLKQGKQCIAALRRRVGRMVRASLGLG